jgi:hypothetical protein
MGPITLFDKSFLQALSVDESVWFSHFFSPLVCPLFYMETIADLQKVTKDGKALEAQVVAMGEKFPDMSGNPCPTHVQLMIGDLMGQGVPLDGRIPMSHGRAVRRGDEVAIVYEVSQEAQAFSRWSLGDFSYAEKLMARDWRTAIQGLNLKASAEQIRKAGFASVDCKTLDDVYRLADYFMTMRDKPFQRMDLMLSIFPVLPQHDRLIRERYYLANYPPMSEFAPYAAHVARVWLFFHFAIAASLISPDRATNQIDISYLYYLPFCHVFTSGDKLHRRAAPYFLRPEQRFVWGPDLKADLRRINEHFASLPDEVKHQGIMSFAHAPPPLDDSIVCQLRRHVMGEHYDSRPPVDLTNPEVDRKVAEEISSWKDAPTTDERIDMEDKASVSLERRVKIKRGSWFQLPHDIKQGEE